MSDSVNIVHVLAELRFGGTEVNTVRLVNALAQRGFNQTVVCLTDRVDAELAAKLQVDLVRPAKILHMPRSFKLLSSVFKERQADLVHGRGFVTWPDCCTAKCLSAERARLIQSFHGPGSFEQRALRRRGIAALLRRGTDVLLGVSHDVARRVVEQWGVPAAKVCVISNGVMLPEARSASHTAEAKAALNIHSGTFVIGSVGSLYVVKNHQFLIDAFARFHRSVPQSRLLLVGGGPLQDELTKQAQALGLANQVTFAGSQAHVGPYLDAMDVFVQPSYAEGSPTAVLEAMACGLPVIAAKSAGCAELHDEHGVPLLVEHDDVAGLAAMLDQLCGDAPRRQSLGLDGRRMVEQHYSFEGMIDHYERLYRALTRPNGWPAAGLEYGYKGASVTP